MLPRLVIFLLMASALASPLRADEGVRQLQEELRKRNLYFGDIDGRQTTELTYALKRYQARKGFAVNGDVDSATAASLHLTGPQLVSTTQKPLPDVPVLRSDEALQIPPGEKVAALEREVAEDPDASPTPFPPAESPAPSDNLTPGQVNKFVEEYLRDGETEDVPMQLRYFSFPVKYFDHGTVDENFVVRDTRNYLKRWPDRKYMLTAPPTFAASGKEGETLVEFTIAFDVRNKNHTASGKTRNLWTVRGDGEALKIVSIREQRLRE